MANDKIYQICPYCGGTGKRPFYPDQTDGVSNCYVCTKPGTDVQVIDGLRHIYFGAIVKQ